MLFDPYPKERRADLFDRERELEALKRGMLRERLVLLLGLRRCGKTSVLNVALKEVGVPSIKVDLRALISERGRVDGEGLYRQLSTGLTRLRRRKAWRNMVEALKSVQGISLGPVEVHLNWRQPQRVSLTDLLDSIDSWCEKKDIRFVLAFDEAQYLRAYGALSFRGLIAYAYDNLPNICFVLTGSEVGVLYDFLRLQDPDSELYGRYRQEIRIERFTSDQSAAFLRAGFKEQGITPPEDLVREAVDRLNGIVGWLTLFGKLCVERGLSKARIEEVFEEAVLMVREELGHLFQFSRRYKLILQAVASGYNRWSSIKNFVEKKDQRSISDRVLATLLKNLIKHGLLVQELRDGVKQYRIPDPLVSYAVLRKS